MTRNEAIAKAEAKAARTGQPHLVTGRTAHPAYLGQTVYLTVAASDKHAWAADERLVFHTDHPHDLAAAWYALDCSPPTGSKQYMTVDEMRGSAQRTLSERRYDAQGRPLCFVCNQPQAAHKGGIECA